MRVLLCYGLALGILASSILGCSSSGSDSNSSSNDGGASDASAQTSNADAGSKEAAGDSGPVLALNAPTITMLMPMTDGLHVMWDNNQKDCDAIEGERKSASEAYKVVFTVPDGSVDNKHDAPLTKGMEYMYRLRCKKGSAYSPYSNEKSGTP